MNPFFIYIIKSSGALFLFFATYKLLLQRETFFNSNRIFLLLGLVLSLAIPFIEFTKTIYIEASQTSNISFIESNISEVLIENKIDWSYIALLIYSSGVLFFSLRFIVQLFSLYKLISNSIVHKKDGYKYVETKKDTSPFSFLNYIVYNTEKHSDNEIKTIIEHEKAHSSQKHSIDIIGAHLLSIFQWINPIAWFYKKAIAQNLEYIADNESIKTVQHTKDYQYLLLNQSSSNYNSSITNTFFNLLIKKRIVMLNKNRSQKQNAWKYGFILPLLTAFILAFNVKTVAQTIKVEEKTKNGFTENELVEFSVHNNTSDNELYKIVEKINTKVKTEYIIRFDGDPIYVLDGKKISKKEFHELKLNQKNSEPPHILTSENAIKKYGEDGKNGVVEITTKNKINYIIQKNHHKDHLEIDTNGQKVKEKNEEEAKNDVLEITTKNPWKVSIGVPSTYNKNELPLEYSISHSSKNSELENIIQKIENSATGVKENTNNSYTISIEGDPLYFLDGKKISKKEFEVLKKEEIATINVLKGEKAIAKYGEAAKDGVVEIITKQNDDKNLIIKGKSNAGVVLKSFSDNNTPPLFILNGNEITEKEMKKIKPENIKEINVLKDEAAIKKYGKKAKDGVVIITTKK